MRTALTEPPLGAIPAIDSVGDVPDRQIDQYLATGAEALALEQARLRASNACLVSKGYRGDLFTADADMAASVGPASDLRSQYSNLYGVFRSVDNVRTDGYQLPVGVAGGYGGTLPSAEDGVSTEDIDACTQAGTDAAAGAPDSLALMEPSALPDGGPTLPTGDSRYTAAVKEWSQCMADRGFDYPDPLTAAYNGWPSTSAPDRVIDQKQVATAVADMQCKSSTNLVGIAVAVQLAYDQAYIDAHAEQLESHRAAIDVALRQAGAA